MEILGKHVASAQNIIHNAESHPTNYSPNFTSDWVNLGPLLHRRWITEDLNQFELPIWKFAYWEEWKKIPEPVCKELQLLKVSVFRLSEEFSMNNHFNHTKSSECKPSLLLTIVQGWCIATGFSQNAL
jgi:hypothetical protein